MSRGVFILYLINFFIWSIELFVSFIIFHWICFHISIYIFLFLVLCSMPFIQTSLYFYFLQYFVMIPFHKTYFSVAFSCPMSNGAASFFCFICLNLVRFAVIVIKIFFGGAGGEGKQGEFHCSFIASSISFRFSSFLTSFRPRLSFIFNFLLPFLLQFPLLFILLFFLLLLLLFLLLLQVLHQVSTQVGSKTQMTNLASG